MSVFPLRPITNEGRNITFTCLLVTASHDSFRSIQWLLNGSELSTLGVDNPFDNFEALGSGVGTLTFIRVPLEYNDTTIQCRGQLALGRNPTSNGVTLLLQGYFAVQHTQCKHTYFKAGNQLSIVHVGLHDYSG